MELQEKENGQFSEIVEWRIYKRKKTRQEKPVEKYGKGGEEGI